MTILTLNNRTTKNYENRYNKKIIISRKITSSKVVKTTKYGMKPLKEIQLTFTRAPMKPAVDASMWQENKINYINRQ